MSTNDTEEVVQDDDKEVTEADLRDLKYGADGVEISHETDEPADDDESTNTEDEATGDEGEQIDDEAKGEEQSKPTFTKKFSNIKGDTPEEYAANLETAYENSTAEYHKLRTEAVKEEPKDGKKEEAKTPDTMALFMQQKMDEEIMAAFTPFQKEYSQVTDPDEYKKFTREVDVLARTILQSQNRLASPAELYKKAAAVLGWEPQTVPTKEEKLKMALKDGGSASKASGSSGKSANKSKVTDEMLRVNRRMYPEKTDAQIREELEPHIA